MAGSTEQGKPGPGELRAEHAGKGPLDGLSIGGPGRTDRCGRNHLLKLVPRQPAGRASPRPSAGEFPEDGDFIPNIADQWGDVSFISGNLRSQSK